MNKLCCLFILILALSTLHAVYTETEALDKFIYGQADGCDYDNWASHLVEGIASAGYNIYAPYDRQLTGFGAYRQPTTAELTQWASVVGTFLSGDLVSCEFLISTYGFPYQVVEFTDTRTGRLLHMLREVPDYSFYDDNGTPDTYDDEYGAFAYGWGLYVVNTDPDALPVIVTTPHPTDDFPTVPFSCKAFEQWNARYWAISGVGREVLWNDDGQGYTNSKSLSDPTRAAAHTYNVVYQGMCDRIREDTADWELCIQLHSYDWSAHQGYATCQISAGGWDCDYPDLPIRDFSSRHLDLINATPWVVLPANTVGIHDDVAVPDYYGVLYTGDFYYHTGSDSIAVPGNIDLPGYSANCQMTYSTSGRNRYDARWPFFHIEMDELPAAYPQTEANMKWFYGWDAVTQRWHMGNLFDRFIDYYSPWLDAMGSILPAYFQFNDNEVPPMPRNFAVHSVNSNYVTLSWDKSDSYDFDSYRILYGTQPISGGAYTIYDREDSYIMATLANEEITISALQPNTQYYFAMQAVDANGNVSDLTDEITCFTGPARIYGYTVQGMSDWVNVRWNVYNQYDCLGFVIDRAVGDPGGQYETIASYVDHDSLQGSTATGLSYHYADYDVERNTMYYYKVSAVWADSTVAHNNQWAGACPQVIWELIIHNTAYTVADTVRFARNAYSSNGYDTPYDIVHGTYPAAPYIHAHFYESSWNTAYQQLYQETVADFDPNTELHTWVMRTRSSLTTQTLYAELHELSANADRNGEKCYLVHGSNWHDMVNDGAYTFTVTDSNWKTMYLYWGNLQPNITFASRANKFYTTGEDIPINWTSPRNFLIDHIDLFARSSTDSLFIAGLAYNATSYTWHAPDTYATDLQIVVRTYFEDGTWTDYTSPYKLGLFPRIWDITFAQGWQLRTNPLSYPDVTWYPPEAVQIWQYLGEDEYAPADTFAFNRAYWLHSNAEYTVANLTFADIQKEAAGVELQSGWNLVPNLFMEDMAVKDLCFLFNSVQYTFAEAVQQGFIGRGVFVYRNGYRQTFNVNPEESYYLFCFVDGLSTWSVPFNENTGYQEFREGWQLGLQATQGGEDTGVLTVGANGYSTAEFDALYDLPKPPRKPIQAALDLFVVNSGQFGPYPDSLYQQDYKLPLDDSQEESESWDILLRTRSLDPVTISVDRALYPAQYGILVELDGAVYNLSNASSFEYTPADTLVWGRLTACNYLVDVKDIENTAAFSLGNWPNPFNPVTTIAFSLPAAAKARLDVYNVKGQRVTTLVNEPLAAGLHQVVWNGRDANNRAVSSGVYFYRLRAGKYDRTRKMLLLK